MNEIPTEILFKIIRMLPGKDIFIYQRVCKRWKNVINELTEDDWMMICERDHRFVHRAYKISKLSYFRLYKSLCLWPKVNSGKMVCDTKKGKNFQFLPGGFLSVCTLENNPCKLCKPNNDCSDHRDKANTLVYYEVYSMLQKNKIVFGELFKVNAYKENEKLIVINDSPSSLIIRIKGEENREFRDESEAKDAISFYLNENKIYIVEKHRVHIYDVQDGNIVKSHYQLEKRWGVIVAVNSFKNNVYAMTNAYDQQGHICILNENGFDIVASFDSFLPHLYEDYGFNWTDDEILSWLGQTYPDEIDAVTSLRIYTACRFGTTTLFATALNKGKIYMSTSRFERQRLRFNKIINIDYGYGFPNLKDTYIEIIDAVEAGDGHIILCLLSDRATILHIDIFHDTEQSENSNRSPKSAETSSSSSGDSRMKRIKVPSPIKPGPSTSCFQPKKPKADSGSQPRPSTSGYQAKKSKHKETVELGVSAFQIPKFQNLSDPGSSLSGFHSDDDESSIEPLSSTSGARTEPPEDQSSMELGSCGRQSEGDKDHSEAGPSTSSLHTTEELSESSSSGLEAYNPEGQVKSKPAKWYEVTQNKSKPEPTLEPKKPKATEHLI